jgi:uncharacterized membrane protein YkoI
MKTSLCSALAVAGLCFASTAFSADQATDQPMGKAMDPQAQTVDLKQLPAAVQATIDREGGRVTKAHEGMENGSKYYDVTVSKDGKPYLLQIDTNGTIVKREAGRVAP